MLIEYINMKNNEMMRLVLIVVAACVFIYLIHSYNNTNNLEQENFFADGENTESAPNNVNNESVENVMEEQEDEGVLGEVDEESADPLPSEQENNETFRTVPEVQEEEASENDESAGRLPNECYPKDVLTPQDLLPQDSNSTWAQTVPAGQGSLGDQNFLNAGFHVGINTVGQSLRNANLQLRSEPANPQMKVSPWLQSTIEPDANRRAMEIGA
jgi:FtsZ-interacting cell division protein ZipA